jgi:uncharacterized protein (DUF58 family)
MIYLLIISIIILGLVFFLLFINKSKEKNTEILTPQYQRPNTNAQSPSKDEVLELLKEVKSIELQTKQSSKDLFTGSYHSAFKGKGMSFSEVRAYNYGDDVRNIDWNVTARNNDPYIKVFEEERELTLMLMIDTSFSTQFGTSVLLKNKLIAKISALLSISAIKNNDKVGVLMFSDKIEKYIPPKKGRSHVLRVIRDVLTIKPSIDSTKTDIDQALRYMNNMLKKRAIVFLVSDFITETSFEDALKITKKRHDFRGVHVYDDREQELPDIGLIKTKDAESGKEIWIDSSDKATRSKYNDWFKTNLQKTKQTFLKAGSELISIETMQNYTLEMMKAFRR